MIVIIYCHDIYVMSQFDFKFYNKVSKAQSCCYGAVTLPAASVAVLMSADDALLIKLDN